MKILFVLLLALGCYANPTGSELKKTPSTVFDFTMVPSNDIKETLQDMIMVEIGKELFLERRKNNLWQCQVDPFGTDYCPTGLAPAKPYTAYYQSTTYERESAVMDYQTGTAVSKTSNVVDYTNKITSAYYVGLTYGLEQEYCTYEKYGRCQTYEWRPVETINVVTSVVNSCAGSEHNVGCADISYFSRIRLKSNCPTGTVLEGSQCKGINYVCPAGYSDNGSNCKKTINYALYQYTCPSGYTVANAGLTTCTKTDPNTTTDNTSTLDDACNSATPPVGNCSKSISYKYYEYLCQAKNSFLEPIKNLNTGLNACSKTDSDKTKDNTGTLDDACNSSTPPTNNCQSTEYTCNSALFKPVYVGGKWVCSPYLCNDDMKCGYGTCDLPTTPSATKYQDIAYNPVGTVNDNKCNGGICDFVVNARVTYCESKQCPKGDDIIEKNGKCYKLECPAGTYLSGEKCIKVN